MYVKHFYAVFRYTDFQSTFTIVKWYSINKNKTSVTKEDIDQSNIWKSWILKSVDSKTLS